MLRSGMGPPSLFYFQSLVDSGSVPLSVSDGIDHLSAAVNAVAAGKISGIAGLHGYRINHHATVVQLKLRDLLEKIRLALLSQRLHHHAHFQVKLRSGNGNEAGAPLRAVGTLFRRALLRAHTFKSCYAAVAVIDDADRQRLPQKRH